MLRKLTIVILLALLPFASKAQYKWDFGLGIGGANYLGEMGGKAGTRRNFVADMKIAATRPAIAPYVRMKMGQNLSLRGGLAWVRISGADSLSLNRGRVGRNLSFRNDIYEVSVLAEYNFYSQNDIARFNRKRVDIRSYAFGGAAGFYHNPVTQYNGSWVPLRPLHTEGQTMVNGRKEYSKFSFGVPVGVGVYWIYNRVYKLGVEVNWRLTFTDYLDDVSTTYVPTEYFTDPTALALQNRRGETTSPNAAGEKNYGYDYGNKVEQKRGDPTHKDNYLTTSLTFSYSIRGKNSFYKSKYNYITGKRKMRKRRVRAKF